MGREAPHKDVLGAVTFANDAVLDGDFKKKPVTIDYDRWNAKTEKNTLFGQQTATPGKYAPFMLAPVMSAYTAETPSCVIPVADTGKFAVGDTVNWYDVSLSAKDTGADKEIADIDTATGEVTLNEAFDNAPTAESDLLMLCDGTELSADVVIVEEEIDFSSTRKPEALEADIITAVIYKGRVDINLINRTTYLDTQRIQRIIFDTLQR